MDLNQDINAHSNLYEITINFDDFTSSSGATKQLVDEELNQSKINDALIKNNESPNAG
ncbi:1311_t:CDS:2 [Gigaspora margarita]|uniref:1311_t:CDS:1 n=1 Tax=Gigaspora margarita TaxID=4874 RepID=A0ABM8W1Y0_GIGMA|nr:1311_t:CDS:2 [Gigaspora margarita]